MMMMMGVEWNQYSYLIVVVLLSISGRPASKSTATEQVQLEKVTAQRLAAANGQREIFLGWI